MRLSESPRVAGVLVAMFVSSFLLAGAFGIVLLARVDSVVTTTHTLLTDGKSASAVDARRATVSAKLATQVEANAVTQIEAVLARNHLTGLSNQELLCLIVQSPAIHAPTSAITKDCAEIDP